MNLEQFESTFFSVKTSRWITRFDFSIFDVSLNIIITNSQTDKSARLKFIKIEI